MNKMFSLNISALLIAILFSVAKTAAAADPYAVISERNLFRPDRTEWIIENPDAKIVDKKIDPAKLELYGTIIIGDKKSALIHEKKSKKKDKKTEVYSLGDYIGGYVISAIAEKRVVLDYYGEKLTLYLHEGKESTREDTLPPPEEKPKPKPKKITRKAQKKEKKNMLTSGKIPEALAKSPFMSEENMKKILEFNKEIMEELKSTGGTLDQESIKEKVEKFRERFMDEMEKMDQ